MGNLVAFPLLRLLCEAILKVNMMGGGECDDDEKEEEEEKYMERILH